MEQRDIIVHRMQLLSDVLEYLPGGAEGLFAALTEDEQAALLALLDKLTDQAESIICRQEAETVAAMPDLPQVELGPNELLCTDCQQYCRLSWDEQGNISGARCAVGYQSAREYLARLG